MNTWMTGSAIALALAAAFFYGLALVLTQIGLRRLPPLGAAAISVPSAAALFVVLAPFIVNFSGFDLTALAIFVGVGLLFPATVTLLTFAANVRMGPNVTGAIGNLTPLFAVALSVTFLGEAFTILQACGIGVILIGVSLLSATRRQMKISWPLWLVLLPLAGAVIRGVTQPGIKFGLTLWPDPFAALTIGYVMSAALLLITARLRGPDHRGRRQPQDVRWFAMVGLCNGIAVLLTYGALFAGDVSKVSPLIATYPLVTLMISVFVLRTVRWSGQLALGVGATVIGVAVILIG